jgi:hypothetical protein
VDEASPAGSPDGVEPAAAAEDEEKEETVRERG